MLHKLRNSWHARRFWKAYIAGRLGMLCVDIGWSDMAVKLIDYERVESIRVVRGMVERSEKARRGR